MSIRRTDFDGQTASPRTEQVGGEEEVWKIIYYKIENDA